VLRGIDDIAEFRWALAQLPARQRAVLVLRYWDDLPVAEVAGILGCSAGTVKSTASRAAARLARTLTRAGAAPESAAPETRRPRARVKGRICLGIFQLAKTVETSATLITAGSYTCTSTAPTTLPTGGALLHWPK